MIAEPPIIKKQWTYAEVSQFEDNGRYEIHNGKLFKLPSPTLTHQRILGRLLFSLATWADTHGGRVFLSPLDLYISETELFIPDLTFYTRESLENP